MIYVISDIHGNYDALKIFFKRVKIRDKDLVISLGDYIGYYYESNKCINLLRKKNVICLKGNHDDNFINSINNRGKINFYSNKYGNAYKFSKKTISKENLFFLSKLKKNKLINIQNVRLSFSHGTPWKINQYIYPDTEKKILLKFRKLKQDIFFIGHTHRRLELKVKNKKIYNPGSIGQPRDGKKGLHWIEFNEKTHKVVFKSSKYCSSSLKKKIMINDKVKYNQLAKYL
jgi:putative phosphoesterase